MMARKVFVLFLFGLATQASSLDISPLALIDEVNNRLEELRETVVGAIFVAEDDLDNLQSDFEVNSNNIRTSSEISMQQEETAINDQLSTIKTLAQTAGIDITYCLRGREQYLENLLPVIVEELASCISAEIDEGKDIITSSKYLVDVTINTVDGIQFQLSLCNPDSEGCISPLLVQIELETEQLPQQIKIEVSRASDLFEELAVSVQECSDLKVSQYTSSGSTILRDITQCVDNILG